MMRHVERLLYEYLRAELDAPKQDMVSRHLASCEKCSTELADLKSAIDVLEALTAPPSNEQSDEFWNAFAFQVEERIRRGQRRNSVPVSAFVERLFVLNRRPLILFGSGLVAAVVLIAGLFLLRQPSQPVQLHTADEPVLRHDGRTALASERLHQYFRKSKVLLVGIANMNVDEEDPIDLSAERRISRNLIEEARYLQYQPMDRRSEKLIGDLEKILIELANMKEHNEMPNVEILRGGIHQENLLFKIRMAESMYDSAQFLQAMNKY